MDVLNAIEMVEFGLTLVEEMAAAISFWISCVDLPPSNTIEVLPSSILGGKKMRIAAKVNRLNICVRGELSFIRDSGI